MISMIEHIEYLMLSNDCVVVPGFGAFIAQYTSSYNSPLTSTFTEPKRNISFNASINHNDGLLANSIAKRASVSYADALKIIDKSTTICRQALREGSEVPFGRLGFFINNSEGNLEFVPFHHEQANDNYFGLQSFTFPTLEERNRRSEEVKSAKSLTVSTQIATSSKVNWFSHKALQMAASIVVLVCLAFALSTPMVVDQPTHQMASLNVPSPTMPKHKAKKACAASVNTRQANATSKNEETDGRYAIIVCSLKKKSQVDKFFKTNKDINPGNVVSKNGFYMIYFNRSDNYQQLLDEAKHLPKAYTEYWIANI